MIKASALKPVKKEDLTIMNSGNSGYPSAVEDMAVRMRTESMEENYEIKDAQRDARAKEILKDLEKYNMTADETVETLYRVQDMIRTGKRKMFLKDLMKQMS